MNIYLKEKVDIKQCLETTKKQIYNLLMLISLTITKKLTSIKKGGFMLHEPSSKVGIDKAAKKKASLGVKMFIFYTLVYSGFVIIGLTKPELMGLELISGQNIAIIYGFGLIILAIVMGFIYNYFCTKMENKITNTNI